MVGKEADRANCIRGRWETQQEIQFLGIYLLGFEQDLESDLGGESQLVTFKQASGSVHEDRVGDTVNEVEDTLLYVLRFLSPLNCLVEYNTESLWRKKNAHATHPHYFHLFCLV